MLTRQLLRYRIAGDHLEPLLLRPTPAAQELAGSLLAHWRDGLGRRRGELDDGEAAILHGARRLVLGRGLSKVLTDACAFTDPAPATDLRRRAFAAAAARLTAPAADADAHRAAVAAELGLDPAALADGLYADLPDRAVLAAVPAWDAAGLIARYNLALCQGLLLSARVLQVEVADRDLGLRRRLLRALVHRRLCAEVSAGPGGTLRLEVSGPAALLDQRAAYGLQLAQWLPALACAGAWHAVAEVRPPRAEAPVRLELDARLGLPGDLALLDWVPPELAAWLAQLGDRLAPWRAVEAEPILLPGGAIVLPDLALDDGGGAVAVELFHRWHLRQLGERLRQLRAGLLPGLVIGIDRALARLAEARPLLDDPLCAERGFAFSDLPSARALGEALARRRAGG